MDFKVLLKVLNNTYIKNVFNFLVNNGSNFIDIIQNRKFHLNKVMMI
jgi:hypothetical protein